MQQRKIPCCRAHFFGSGKARIYSGPIYQRFYGFLGDAMKYLIPIFTSRVLPYVGRRLHEASEQVADDMGKGESLGRAIKRSAKQVWQRGKADAVRKLTGRGYKKKKRNVDYLS